MQSAKHFNFVLYSLGTQYAACIDPQSYFRQSRY